MDPYLNFAGGELLLGINAAATSATMATGEGAYLPSTSGGAFNAVLYDAGNYSHPQTAYRAGYAEIVRVTNRSSDTLTITRAQEGTAAVDFSGLTVGVLQILTKKWFDDLQLSLPTGGAGTPESTIDGNKYRTYYDETEGRLYMKTTVAGTLTGWQ